MSSRACACLYMAASRITNTLSDPSSILQRVQSLHSCSWQGDLSDIQQSLRLLVHSGQQGRGGVRLAVAPFRAQRGGRAPGLLQQLPVLRQPCRLEAGEGVPPALLLPQEVTWAPADS